MGFKPDIEGHLLDSVLQLEVRYPALLHKLRTTGISIEVYFYHEEIAMECASALARAGITAQQHPTYPRAVILPLEPIQAFDKLSVAVQALSDFLNQLDNLCQKNPPPPTVH